MSDDENFSDSPLPRSPELMRPDDTALLVVDLQDRLLPAIAGGRQVVWNCRRLVDGARLLGVRVAATEQNPEKLGATIESVRSRLPASAAAKMAFSCGECVSVLKPWFDAGIRRVLVCGIEAHVCVQQTVLDLLAAGMQTFVAVDAIGARNAIDYQTALRRMESSGAVLTTVESALFEWCQRAGTPEFRQISALVKETPPVE